MPRRFAWRNRRRWRRLRRRCRDEPDPSDSREVVDETVGEDTDAADDGTLKVTKTDLNIPSNTKRQRTDDYDITDSTQGPAGKAYLVCRRGEPFDLTITFNRMYNRETDDLSLRFGFGEDSPPQITETLILSGDDIKGEWGAWIKSTEGNDVVIAISPAADCPVGKWFIRIEVVKKKDTGDVVHRWEIEDPIYILFNCYCPEDDVYLQEGDLCKEYVLAEDGIVYRGSAARPSGIDWDFAQFSSTVLDCCLDLLDDNMVDDRDRGNVVLVTRMISKLVNSNDEGGIISGKWKEPYDDGVAPWYWTGSEAIFNQYHKTGRPVKYGQCWVFSALCTTYCRALGIPCRSVTNYDSAHDTNQSLTIDMHFDMDLNPIKRKNLDSVWNFHVWNECWMRRRDLPDGYGGWQALDATPQERSDGVMCCGPTSLVALRNGDVHLLYDGAFVFAECNADRCYYLWFNGQQLRAGEEIANVGRKISTKKANSSDREDLTDHYKHPEGSDEERIVMQRAKTNLCSKKRKANEEKKDVFCRFDYDQNTFYGQDLTFSAIFKNTSDADRTFTGQWGVDSIYYTGAHNKSIKRKKIKEMKIEPNSEEKLTMTLTLDEYYSCLAEQCFIKFVVLGKVDETNSTFFECRTERLRKPHLTFQVKEKAIKGEAFTVTTSFTNPLNMTLTLCEVVVSGHGLTLPRVYKQRNVGAGSTFTGSFSVIPSKVGGRTLSIAFNSAQLASVTGALKVDVGE